jgi:peptide deformylase
VAGFQSRPIGWPRSAFGKGLGPAAPQLGIDRAAAIVRPPGGDTITLLNPRATAETDEQYEGCLSLFHVRGMVPRPLAIEVEHQDVDGHQRITIFERAVARLVAHELDHLMKVYKPKESSGVGQGWRY